MYHTFLHGKNKQNLVSSPLQEKLREAAKARLRRMMRNHATKKGLNVPDWAKEQYKVRGQDGMPTGPRTGVYIYIYVFICSACELHVFV